MATIGQDPYRILAVLRTADDRTIRSAYRRLVKECHPDLHPNSPQAEEQFKALTLAYSLLSDPEKRRKFDRGELGPDGTPRAGASGTGQGPAAGDGMGGVRGQNKPFRDPYMDESGFDTLEASAMWENLSGSFTAGRNDFDAYNTPPSASDDDLDDLFKEIFREAGSPGSASGGRASGGNGLRGRDIRYSLTISFAEACYGARKRLPLNSGRDVDISIPPASENGQVIRLAGRGQPGATGALAGDLLVEILVQPHPFFTRQGLDLHAPLSLSLSEAVLGGRITMQGVRGPLSVVVPAAVNSGQRLRIKNLGVRAGEQSGDLFLTIAVILPPQPDEELKAFLQDWGTRNPYHLPGR